MTTISTVIGIALALPVAVILILNLGSQIETWINRRNLLP